jgi:uncharacterized protein YdhG (YjbR/CyaY superfamily)
MAQSKAATVAEYLESLPADRRTVIAKVRDVIRKHLPKGYEEAMAYGVISYQVPLEKLSTTYNGQPLCYAALAAQKNYNTLYVMGAYGDPTQRKQLDDAFKKAGKKLKMGKSCIHFQDADDLPLADIGKMIAAIPPDKWISIYQSSRKKR